MKVYGHSPEEWGDLVAEAKRLFKRQETIRWAWADFFLKVTPHSIFPDDGGWTTRRAGRPGIKETLKALRDEAKIEVSLHTMTEHRMIALNWPPERRVSGASWSAHRALVGHPNRFDLLKPGMTYKQASVLADRDLSHLEKKASRKRGDLKYEDVYDYVAWANRLLRRAGAVAAGLTLDYKQRSSLQELLQGTYDDYENTRNIIATQTQKRRRAA